MYVNIDFSPKHTASMLETISRTQWLIHYSPTAWSCLQSSMAHRRDSLDPAVTFRCYIWDWALFFTLKCLTVYFGLCCPLPVSDLAPGWESSSLWSHLTCYSPVLHTEGQWSLQVWPGLSFPRSKNSPKKRRNFTTGAISLVKIVQKMGPMKWV